MGTTNQKRNLLKIQDQGTSSSWSLRSEFLTSGVPHFQESGTWEPGTVFQGACDRELFLGEMEICEPGIGNPQSSRPLTDQQALGYVDKPKTSLTRNKPCLRLVDISLAIMSDGTNRLRANKVPPRCQQAYNKACWPTSLVTGLLGTTRSCAPAQQAYNKPNRQQALLQACWDPRAWRVNSTSL